jgi:hypothetical protein
MNTTTARKQKNAYEVRLITKAGSYDFETRTRTEDETIVLGYVNSVSERGAHTIAARTIDGYPWHGRGVRLINLTEQARREAANRERENKRNATRAASGLTEQQLDALAEEYWNTKTEDALRQKLGYIDRAIGDAHQRVSWDRLDERAPEVAEVWHNMEAAALAVRAVIAAEYREELGRRDALELRAVESGAIFEDERGYLKAGGRVLAFDYKEAGE